MGLAESLANFDTVIFIDASVNNEPVSLQEISLDKNQPQSFSHHINAAMLVGLVKQLYPTHTRFYVCAIGAKNFEMGNTISEKALNNANKAISLLSEKFGFTD